jgi:RND family efflux transporter MFP subunit
VAVEVVAPQKRDVDRTIELPADVRARQVAQVYSKVAGHIKELRTDIGRTVRAGEVLAVLEAPELERDTLAAQSQADKARSEEAAAQAQWAAQASQAQADEQETERARAQAHTARSEFRQAEAQRRYADESYRRLKSVYDEDHGLIARQQLDQAYADFKVAVAQREARRQACLAADRLVRAAHDRATAARNQVSALGRQRQAAAHLVESRGQEALRARDWEDYRLIRAPFDGVVSKRYLDVGALMESSAQNSQTNAKPLVEVVGDGVVTVAVRVPETEAPLVKPGNSVELTAEALPEEKFAGKVTRISVALSSESDRAMLAEIDLPNRPRKLQPGMFLHCLLTLATHKNVLALPAAAVLDEKGKTSVFVTEGGKASKKPVKLGFRNPQWCEIQEGLAGSESVVVKGKEKLSDGAPVQIK